jgi:ribosomal 50S subunit-recycling heat shock protein
MRYCNKYKSYTKTNLFLKKSSLRVLNFNRPKWKKLQSIISSKKLSLTSFNDTSICKVNYKIWDKIKNHYKDGLYIKNSIYKLFDNSFSTRYYKKKLLNKNLFFLKNIILNSIIKPNFRLDILLWKLNFFKSPYESKQAIQTGHIFVNNKIQFQNSFVKKGDIISFKLNSNGTNVNFLNKFEPDLLFSFTEIDYYSSTIIILKDYYNLSNEDFSLLITESINFKKFVDYIKSK